eukprot:scaffold162127_cov19-Prasinocladus_malaysianus.AAC.1
MEQVRRGCRPVAAPRDASRAAGCRRDAAGGHYAQLGRTRGKDAEALTRQGARRGASRHLGHLTCQLVAILQSRPGSYSITHDLHLRYLIIVILWLNRPNEIAQSVIEERIDNQVAYAVGVSLNCEHQARTEELGIMRAPLWQGTFSRIPYVDDDPALAWIRTVERVCALRSEKK